MTAALELDRVSKHFGPLAALDDVSLRVTRGSLFGLLGPNGAGKTTLLSIAAGFLRPDTGEARVLGALADDFGTLRGRLAMLPQDADLQGGVAVGEQLTLFARLSGLRSGEARSAAHRALEAVRLGDAAGRLPRALSHGMRKRVALAQALIGEPELLFLDEPTAGLDPENARHTRELIRALRGQRTVVLCSHNLHEIQELCDEVAVLHRGRVAECGRMEGLTEAARLLRVTLGQPRAARAAEALAPLDVVDRVEVTGELDFNVHLADAGEAETEAAVEAVLARLLAQGLVPRRLLPGASLESRYLEVTGGRFDGASGT